MEQRLCDQPVSDHRCPQQAEIGQKRKFDNLAQSGQRSIAYAVVRCRRKYDSTLSPRLARGTARLYNVPAISDQRRHPMGIGPVTGLLSHNV